METKYEQKRRGYDAARRSSDKFAVGLLRSIGPERAAEAWERGRQTRREMIARDRRRISLGLHPLTKMVKPVTLTRTEITMRNRMKKRGYLVFRGDPCIYYDNNTARDDKREQSARALGLAVVHINKRQPV